MRFESREHVCIQWLQKPRHLRWHFQHPHVMSASVVHDISMNMTASGVHDKYDLVLSKDLLDALVNNRDNFVHDAVIDPYTLCSPCLHKRRLIFPFGSQDLSCKPSSISHEYLGQ